MATINLLSNSCGVVFANPIGYVQIDVIRIPTAQRMLIGSGINDVVNGVTLSPTSTKYPGLMYVRFLDANRKIVGIDNKVDFKSVKLIAPSSDCYGVEIYVNSGTVFNLTTGSGNAVVDLTNYYTKSQIDSLFANYVPSDSSQFAARLQTDFNNTVQAAQADNATLQATLTNLQGFTHKQSANPFSPATVNGETWREIDSNGNIIMDWVYLTGTGWISLQEKSVFAVFGNGTVTATQQSTYATASPENWNIYLEQAIITAYTDGVDSGNWWNFEMVLKPSLGGDVSVATYSLKDTGFGAGWLNQSLLYNQVFSIKQYVLVGINIKKFNNPNPIYPQVTVFFRYHRSTN